MPTFVVADSISEAVKSRTAPLVEASIHACRDKSESRIARHGLYTYPRNESLVETGNASSAPHCLKRLEHGLRAVGRHLCLDDLQRLTKGRYLLQDESLAPRFYRGGHTSCIEPMRQPTLLDDECLNSRTIPRRNPGGQSSVRAQ